MMSMEPAACEGEWWTNKVIRGNTHIYDFPDLKAFERRLTEVIGDLAPATLRWRSKDIGPDPTIMY